MALGQEALAVELEEAQRQLRDVTEERDFWKVRCLRAETEVRALKRQSKLGGMGAVDSSSHPPLQYSSGYASPTSPPASEMGDMVRRSSNAGLSVSGITDRLNAPGMQNDVVVFRLRQELGALQEQQKTLETSNTELREACQQQEMRVQQPQSNEVPPGRAYATSCDSTLLDSPEELRHKLKEKNEAIMQLQSDMVRENRLIEKQKKAAEMKNVLCSEELVEMTARAKSLSEQVNRSRKKGAELQAAKEESGKWNSRYEECEARLAEESSQMAALQYKLDEVFFELKRDRTDSELARGEHKALQDAAKERSLMRGNEHIMLESRLAASTREASEAMEQKAAAVSKLEELSAAAGESGDLSWQAKQQKVTQGVGLIRQLCADLQKEIRTDRVRRPLEKLAPTRSRRVPDNSSPRGSPANADQSSTSDKVMMRLMKHLDRVQQVLDQPMPKPPGRSSSPEGEHPQPEEHRKMFQLLTSDANETLQQELNDYRLEAESIREKMTTEHYEEIDGLLNEFNRERVELHEKIQEISDKCAKAEVAGAAVRPMSDLRQHVERQVEMLVSQFSDLDERERKKRMVDETDLQEMQQTLEKCRLDLAAGQEEFSILSALFDKERRENLQLKQSQREMELQLKAWKEGPHRNVSAASSLLQQNTPHSQHNTPHERAHPVHHAGWTSASANHGREHPSALPPQALIATVGATTSQNFSDHDRTPLDDRAAHSHRSPVTSGTWDLQMIHHATHSTGSLTDVHTLTPSGGTPTITPPRVVTPAMVSAPPPLAQRAWTEGSETGGSTPGAVTTPSRPTRMEMPARRGGAPISRGRYENHPGLV